MENLVNNKGLKIVDTVVISAVLKNDIDKLISFQRVFGGELSTSDDDSSCLLSMSHELYHRFNNLHPGFTVISKKRVIVIKWTRFKNSGKYYDSGLTLVDWYDDDSLPWSTKSDKKILSNIWDILPDDGYVVISELDSYETDPSYDRLYTRLIKF